MIVNMFQVRVPEQAVARFEQSWQQRAGRVDSMPGFRGLEVLRDGAEVGHYVVLTHWETRQDYENWANSPEFVAGHSNSGQSAAQSDGVTFYEVVPS